MAEVNNIEEERLSGQAVEDWVEDAFDEMTIELSNLFIVMSALNEGIASLISEAPARDKFQRCFPALNLFVIPCVLSIGICWAVGFQQNSSTEKFIMFLMSLSMVIGLPYYVFSIWNAYFDGTTIENSVRQVNSEWKEGDDKIKEYVHNNTLMLPVFKDSIERFSEMSRLLNQRLRYNIRLELERILNEVEEVESIDAETMVDNNIDKTSKSNEQDLDSDCCSSSVEPFQKKANESCGVQIILLNNTQDMTVEIEKDVHNHIQDLTIQIEKENVINDLDLRGMEKEVDVLNNSKDLTMEMEKEGDVHNNSQDLTIQMEKENVLNDLDLRGLEKEVDVLNNSQDLTMEMEKVDVLNNSQDVTVEMEKEVLNNSQVLTVEMGKAVELLSNSPDLTVKLEEKVDALSETEENEEESEGDDLVRTGDSHPSRFRDIMVKPFRKMEGYLSEKRRRHESSVQGFDL